MSDRTGALFRLGSCLDSDLPQFARLLLKHPKQLELIQGIYDLCQAAVDNATDMPTLTEHLGISRPTVIQRARPLQERGLLRVSSAVVRAGIRSANIYELVPPPASDLGPAAPMLFGGTDLPVEAAADDTEQTRFDFTGARFPEAATLHYHPDIDRRLAWKGDRFMVFALLAGLRVGRTGRETRIKHTRVYLGPKHFRLEIRAAETAQIPSVIDLRVLIVVCTLIKGHLDGAKTQNSPDQGFVITLADICEAMALDPVSGNKRLLFEQLSRWRSSEFVIKETAHGALDWAKGIFEIGTSFSVINQLTVLKHASAIGITPELIHLTLNPRLVDALRDVGQTLSVHSQILHDRKPKPFDHLIYYWCRRVVQHAPEPRIFLLEHIHRELRPHISMKKFRHEFAEFIDDHKVVGTDSAPSMIPGYILRYDPRRGEVAIQANPNDVLVGLASPRSITAQTRRLRHLITWCQRHIKEGQSVKLMTLEELHHALQAPGTVQAFRVQFERMIQRLAAKQGTSGRAILDRYQFELHTSTGRVGITTLAPHLVQDGIQRITRHLTRSRQ